MAYTRTTWVDGSTPAINATNLNNIEQGLVDLHSGDITITGSDRRFGSRIAGSDRRATAAQGDPRTVAYRSDCDLPGRVDPQPLRQRC